MRPFLQASVVTLTLALISSEAFAAKKPKKQETPVPPPAPEMKIDPNLINTYKSGAFIESKRVEKSDVQFIAVEPSLDMHQFTSFKARNDYFEVPLNGGSKSSIAPSVWLGHPTGAVWFSLIRVRAGLDLSYIGYDGAQTVHHRTLNLDFKDNISSHAIPLVASTRLTSATKNESTFGISPWLGAGVGMMLSQVTGSLDGTSQNAWTPISRLSGGLRYSLMSHNGFVGGVNAGVFSVSGSSKKAQWRGTGVTVGADILL